MVTPTPPLVDHTKPVDGRPRFLSQGIVASAAAHIVGIGCVFAGAMSGVQLPESSEPVRQVNSIRLTAAISATPRGSAPPRVFVQPTSATPRTGQDRPQRVPLATALSKIGTLPPPHGTRTPNKAVEARPEALPCVSQRTTREHSPPFETVHLPPTPLLRDHVLRDHVLRDHVLRDHVPLDHATAVAAVVASIEAEQLTGAESFERPRVFYNPTPQYPVELQIARIEGVVRLRVSLEDSGTVESVILATSSGVPALDQSAIKTMRKWRFEPQDRQHPTVREFIKPFRFALQAR